MPNGITYEWNHLRVGSEEPTRGVFCFPALMENIPSLFFLYNLENVAVVARLSVFTIRPSYHEEVLSQHLNNEQPGPRKILPDTLGMVVRSFMSGGNQKQVCCCCRCCCWRSSTIMPDRSDEAPITATR